jgi:hypothetical protein
MISIELIDYDLNWIDVYTIYSFMLLHHVAQLGNDSRMTTVIATIWGICRTTSGQSLQEVVKDNRLPHSFLFLLLILMLLSSLNEHHCGDIENINLTIMLHVQITDLKESIHCICSKICCYHIDRAHAILNNFRLYCFWCNC